MSRMQNLSCSREKCCDHDNDAMNKLSRLRNKCVQLLLRNTDALLLSGTAVLHHRESKMWIQGSKKFE